MEGLRARARTARRSLTRGEVALGRLFSRHAEPIGPPPDPTRPVGTDCLPQIKHIVVLMMENHSYDNYFGALERGDGLPRDDSGRPTASNPAADGTPVGAHRLSR